MNLFILAARNLWRNTRRTLITIAGIAGGLAFMLWTINFQQGSYDQTLNTAVRMLAGHIVVQAEGWQEDREMGQVVERSGQIAQTLRETVGEGVVQRKAMLGGTLMSPANTRMVMLNGVQPGAEAQITDYDDKIVGGSWLEDQDARGIVLGKQLARSLEVEPGDRIVYQGPGAVKGETVSRMFRVRGVFETGMAEQDGFLAFVDLAAAQEMLPGEDPAHQIAVLLDTDLRLDELYPAAEAAIDQPGVVVLDWRGALPELIEVIELDRKFGDMMWAVLGLMVAFAVLNTILMSVLERTREFGVMMSVGMSPRRLARLVVTEAFIMGLIGAGCAFALGSLATWPMVVWGWDLSSMMGDQMAAFEGVPMDSHAYSVFDWERMLLFSAIGVLFTVLASLWPAWMVTRLEPVQAMRPQ